MSLPKYGIIQWRDATVIAAKAKQITRLTKNLVVKESLGWLFEDADGSVAVIQERTLVGGIQRNIEATVVPKAWIINIVELKANGNGSRTEDVSGSEIRGAGSSVDPAP